MPPPQLLKRSLGPLHRAYVGSRLYEKRFFLHNRRLLEKARFPYRLHVGCGPHVLPSWVNIDMGKRDGVMALRVPRGLAHFPADSVEYVYSSHMVEHMSYPEEVGAFFREVYRVLRPRGVFRLVVPGIERAIRAYFAGDDEFFRSIDERHPRPAYVTTPLESVMWALQRGGAHKYGYDFETAEKALRTAGFDLVTESAFNESEHEELRVDYRREGLSLFVEATKLPRALS